MNPYFVTCYQLTESECHIGINSDLFQSFALSSPDKPIVDYGTISMYPIYQELADRTQYGDALYPYSVSFILQYKPKQQQTAAQDAAIIAVPTKHWTIMSEGADKSILLDPSGNQHVLLFAQTGRLYLKHRSKPNTVLIMPTKNVPQITLMDKASQFAAAFKDQPVHPHMNLFAQHAVAKRTAKQAVQRKVRSKQLSSILS